MCIHHAAIKINSFKNKDIENEIFSFTRITYFVRILTLILTSQSQRLPLAIDESTTTAKYS